MIDHKTLPLILINETIQLFVICAGRNVNIASQIAPTQANLLYPHPI